jgi:rare lipoprotein A
MPTAPLARSCLALLLGTALLAHVQPAASQTSGPTAAPSHRMEGRLTYYAKRLHGRLTASGERFDAKALTMAHQTLPFGTLVQITNLSNQRSVVVRVNDRGNWGPDRVGDVSMAAARALAMLQRGVVSVQLKVLSGPDDAHTPTSRDTPPLLD